MKEEYKVKLVDMLGEEKANLVFKQIEDEAKQMTIREQAKKDEEARMVNAMIDKGYLIGGEYYSGHRFRGKYVAMWDAQEGCFLTINYTMGSFFVERLPYFGDVAHTNQDGFIPFDKIEKRKF
jgi:hypothetical protein